MRHKEIQTSLYEYARGELDADRAKQIQDHVAGCNRCFGELQILQRTIRLLPSRTQSPSSERTEAYWARFAAQVEGRAHTEEKQVVVTNPVWEGILSAFTYRRSYVLSALGTVAVAVVSLLLWSSNPSSQQSDRDITQIKGGVSSDPAQIALADYFRKSKILLVGISNISANKGERIDLSTERQAARELIQQARYLDNRVLDDRSQQLIKALERILLELANMQQHANLPDVEIVRSGIHDENMLFKIRMAESQ